jgi:biotin carboxyl carrier protein
VGAKEGRVITGGEAQARKPQKTTETTGKTVYAPMPARVVKISCRAGGHVKKGDLLMIVEAMKMENEILSPIDGAVKEVCVVEGASVLNEERLVVFE